MEKRQIGDIPYPTPSQSMNDSNLDDGNEALRLKGDIVSALYLNETEAEGVIVQGRSSHVGSQPTAWVYLQSVDGRTFEKFHKLGWKCISGGAYRRKVRLVLDYEGVAT